MGGKQGSSSTQIEIPDWLEAEMKPFLADSLANFGKFSKAGMGVIMPGEGKTGVKVRNPWDIVPTDVPPTPKPDPGPGPGDGSLPPAPPEDPTQKPVDNGRSADRTGDRGRANERRVHH